jgi:hypothetical protein
MVTITVLGPKGDQTLTPDPAGVEAGDLDALAAVDEAQRIINEAREKGAAIFAGDSPTDLEIVRGDFNPLTFPEILVSFQLQGG